MKKAADDEMIRTTIYLPKGVHRAMKILAARTGTSMADLLRDSIVQSYKEDMDDIRAADASMRQYRAQPKSAVTLERYIAKRR